MSPTLLAAAAGMALVAVGGCASSGTGGKLSPADFASDTPQEAPAISAAQAMAAPTPAPPEEHSGPVNLTGPIAASEGVMDVTARAGGPEALQGPRPNSVGGAILIDAKIGDVNGRPIYASSFLESRADRLHAMAVELQKKSDAAKAAGVRNVPDWKPVWRAEARREIDSGLNSFIEDELLRAEAIASLAPEQKQNFFAFMQTVSDKMQSENMGSRSAADRALQSQGGLDAYLKAEEQKVLIQFQLGQKINKRVNIAWRDIKLEYDKRVALMGAEPGIVIRRVRIKAANTAAVSEFQRALNEDKITFDKLAENPANLNNPEGGGAEKLDIKGDPALFQYYGSGAPGDPYKPLNDAARSLTSGQTAGPIEIDGYVNWLHRDHDMTIKPLYFAQLEVEAMLRDKRAAAEKARYIERLKAKSTMTSVKEMSDSLLKIAEDRFLPKKAG